MSSLRYVLVGSIDAGKTTLFNALTSDYTPARKTQAIEFNQQGGIDTPGEFFSHPRLYRALISTTTEADIIIYVHGADDPICRLPTGLLEVYQGKQLIVVITKIDLPDVDITATKKMLLEQGLDVPTFEICAHDPDSVRVLADYLEQYELSKRKA